MRVLHVVSELHPFSKTGGLADMVAALAAALAAGGQKVEVVTPLYRGLRQKHPEMRPARWKFDLPLGPKLTPGEFWRLDPAPNLTLWFVDQPEFFDRPGLYHEKWVDYPDNAARFTFLTKAALLLARHLHPRVDLVQCHDWQTGLLPLLLRHAEVEGRWTNPPKTLCTIHNLAYQGVFLAEHWSLTNLPAEWFHIESARHHGFLNFLKAGLALADALATVSPTYAREICTPEFGCGLEGLLRRREYELTGILNGIDEVEWNTTDNPALPFAYDAEHLGGKAANKAALQQELGLPVRADLPLFTNITRLAEQKGADLLHLALTELLDRGERLQFALLGSGDPKLETAFRELAVRHPHEVAVRIGFDPALAHRLEAGSDFYVMPSRFEPCGLNQMYSLRYGSIPVVRATGGLQDSVIDVRESAERATGIKFQEPTAPALANALRKAITLYAEPPLLAHFRHNGMHTDFSWRTQSLAYRELYQHILHDI